jgi:hypothetical protein
MPECGDEPQSTYGRHIRSICRPTKVHVLRVNPPHPSGRRVGRAANTVRSRIGRGPFLCHGYGIFPLSKILYFDWPPELGRGGFLTKKSALEGRSERRRACRPPVPGLLRRFAACQFRRPLGATFPRIALMCSFTAVSVRPRSRAIPLFCLPSIRQVRISASRRDSWPELAAVARGGRVVSGRNRLMHSIPVCCWSYPVCSEGSG